MTIDKERIKRLWDLYIKGKYHCDTCPFCWGGEYLPGCDEYDDCGCYIFDDLRDSCRLPPPIRFLLGWGRRKKAEYHYNHQYDDIGEWYEKRIDQEAKFREAFKDYLETMGYGVVYAHKDGCVVPVNGEYTVQKECRDIYRFMDACEDIFLPVKYVPLKNRWKCLLKDSLDRLLMIFKPYFCK